MTADQFTALLCVVAILAGLLTFAYGRETRRRVDAQAEALQDAYRFLNTIGRAGLRLEPDFPEAEWQEAWEKVGEALYPDG